MVPYQQFTLFQGSLHQPKPDTQVRYLRTLVLDNQKTQHGVMRDVYPQPPDKTSCSSVPQIVLTGCPTSSSDISTKGTPTQVSNSAQRDTSTGSLSYSSCIVKSPRLSLWKREPSATNRTPCQIPDLNRTIKELQEGTIHSGEPSSSSPSPSPLAAKKPARLAKTELRIQESFEIDDEKVIDDGEEDRSQIQERKEDIRQTTYRRLDNLEETIRELELSLLDFGTPAIPTWPQGIPDTNSKMSASTAPPPLSTIKSSGRGEIRRPPVPPKPSINTDAAKVQEHTQPLMSLALLHSLSLSCCRLSILV